jgi:outer membrane biosynthesis protein TonB
MNFGRQAATYVIVSALLLGVACNKKKPRLPVDAHAPTLSVPIAEQIPEPQAPAEEPSTTVAAEPTPEPPKPKPQKRRAKKAPQPAASNAQNSSPTPPASAPAVVATARPPANPVAEATPDMAISADVSRAQLNQQKQTTVQLLDTAEKNLKSLTRTLSHDEEAMVTQVKSYVAQSRKATGDGDFERAYNLATKARLLSDALINK